VGDGVEALSALDHAGSGVALPLRLARLVFLVDGSSIAGFLFFLIARWVWFDFHLIFVVVLGRPVRLCLKVVVILGFVVRHDNGLVVVVIKGGGFNVALFDGAGAPAGHCRGTGVSVGPIAGANCRRRDELRICEAWLVRAALQPADGRMMGVKL
jgi:hypothetical protein